MSNEHAPTSSAPAGAPAPATGAEWWRDAVIYQVYPRSFADSDGDGMGDLPGITGKLGYLADLGVDALWLSPFYRSPQADAGYDVADYREPDPMFGDLADVDAMLARAHELGLKVVVDLVPNHTSDEHAWFAEALASEPGSPARDRYIFRPGTGPDGAEPPNNWVSVFGGGAWSRVPSPEGDATGGEYYLHLFDARQPDLNWNNPEVREEFLAILRFWLDRGVDGFRVDVAHGLVKAEGLPDSVLPDDPETQVLDAFHPEPFWDQDGVHEIYRDWHRVLAEYPGDRMMVAEAWVQPAERLALYVRPDEFQQAFNFAYLETPWDAEELRQVIGHSLWADELVGAPTTWVLSNHDVIRHASRLGWPGGDLPKGIGPDHPQPDNELGLRRARAATLLTLALPGSAYVYQGEELGLHEHTGLLPDVRQDPTYHRTGGEQLGRDGCRVPMPWHGDAPGLGFGPSAKTWLQQPESYRELAADRQAGVDGSTLEFYRTALRLRREHGLGLGAMHWSDEFGTDTVAFTREGGFTSVTNLGAEPVRLPAGAEVLLASGDLDGVLGRDQTVWFIQR